MALLLFAVPEGSAYVPPARKALGPDKTLVENPGSAPQAAEAGAMHGAPAAQEPAARGAVNSAEVSEAAPDAASSQAGQDAVPAQEQEAASGQPAAQVAPSPAHPSLAQGMASDGPPAVLLPRMPMGLALVADPRTYQALASVARGVGRTAAAAGAGHSLFLVPVMYCCERPVSLRCTMRTNAAQARQGCSSESYINQSTERGVICLPACHLVLASIM